jgi:hypothetical protein
VVVLREPSREMPVVRCDEPALLRRSHGAAAELELPDEAPGVEDPPCWGASPPLEGGVAAGVAWTGAEAASGGGAMTGAPPP